MSTARLWLILFFTLGLCSQLLAQDRFELSIMAKSRSRRIPQKTFHLYKQSGEIIIDGHLDEPVWQHAETADNFHQNFPSDTARAQSRTVARFTYDDNSLYAGIICYDDLKGRYIIESLRRDFSTRNNDHVMLVLDPFDDLTNGYVFALTPMGAQFEGLLTGGGGGFRPVSSSWDNIWFSEVTRNDSSWVAEIRIPFKTIRYDDELTNWNIQVVRNDLKRNERSTWTRVERQYRTTALTFSGGFKWDSAPPPAGANVTVIPFLSGSATVDREVEGIIYDGKAGFDGKVALSSAMNLDLTVNPDFSTVEVDEQQTNITRFELFFPEKRQFFLENSDLFADYGFRRSQVFFSRRIGLDAPLLFGARLSGQPGTGLKTGLLNAQTNHRYLESGDDIPAYNYTVATFRRQAFGRSNIAGIFTNKQAINYQNDQEKGYDFGDRSQFNRVYGLQYNLLSANEKWTGSFYGFRSDDPEKKSDNWSHGTNLWYNVRNFSFYWVHEYIGEGFNAEMGFFPRTGFFMFGPYTRLRFYPESRIIDRHGPGFRFFYYLDNDWSVTDREASLSYQLDFLNTSELELELEDSYIKLFDDFDPTRKSRDDTAVVPLPAGSEYQWQNVTLSYESDSRKDYSMDIRTSWGGFYNGTALRVSGRFLFRVKPYFNMALSYSYNSIDLPDPYPDGTLWLIGPRIEFTFTDKIYWTNYIQYNQQSSNLNINSRFQWRFAPASDLFLVYTDNYLPDGMVNKNRALILKISYWINL